MCLCTSMCVQSIYILYMFFTFVWALIYMYEHISNVGVAQLPKLHAYTYTWREREWERERERWQCYIIVLTMPIIFPMRHQKSIIRESPMMPQRVQTYVVLAFLWISQMCCNRLQLYVSRGGEGFVQLKVWRDWVSEWVSEWASVCAHTHNTNQPCLVPWKA